MNHRGNAARPLKNSRVEASWKATGWGFRRDNYQFRPSDRTGISVKHAGLVAGKKIPVLGPQSRGIDVYDYLVIEYFAG